MSGKLYTEHEDEFERDILRARFTNWLEIVIYRARLNYLREQKNRLKTVSIDEVPDVYLEWHEPGYHSSHTTSQDFDFEEERLAIAFSQLPLMRKEVLRLLFVEEMEPAEIAVRMNCSVQHVYNQRSLALRRLRELLEREEKKDGKKRV